MSLEGISLELIEVFLPEHLNQTLLPSMQHKIKIFGPFLMFHFHQTMLHFLCIFFFLVNIFKLRLLYSKKMGGQMEN